MFDKTKGWEQVATRIADRKRKRKKRRQFAVAVACIVLTAVFFKINSNQVMNFFEEKYIVEKTAVDETKNIVLPDGSKVVMNSMSTLKYPAQFASSNRAVELLSGEAMFEVEKDANRPFIVSCEQSTVKVLGTIFNINAYDSTAIYVSLKEGAVQFARGNFQYIMSPDERLSFDKKTHKVKVETIVAETDLAWKEQQWVFQNKSIVHILAQLAQSKQLSFVQKRPDFNYPIVNVFYPKNGASIHEVIALIEEVGKVKIDLSENAIVLH